MSKWTPEKRAAAQRKTRLWWDSPAGMRKREELRAIARERFREWAETHPDRAALVAMTRARMASGELGQPCREGCGRDGQPMYDWDSLEVVGWRCYPCRQAGRSRDKKNHVPQGGREGSTADYAGGTATGTPLREGVLEVSRDRPAALHSLLPSLSRSANEEEKNV